LLPLFTKTITDLSQRLGILHEHPLDLPCNIYSPMSEVLALNQSHQPQNTTEIHGGGTTDFEHDKPLFVFVFGLVLYFFLLCHYTGRKRKTSRNEVESSIITKVNTTMN